MFSDVVQRPLLIAPRNIFKTGETMAYYEGTFTITGDVQLVQRVARNVPVNRRPIYWGLSILGSSSLVMPQRLGDVWVALSQSSSGAVAFSAESVVMEYRPVWSEGVWIGLPPLGAQKEPTNLWFKGRDQVTGFQGFWFYEDSL